MRIETFHSDVLTEARRSFSILPALSLDGFLFASIVEGSYNGALFAEFIETLLEHMTPFRGQIPSLVSKSITT